MPAWPRRLILPGAIGLAATAAGVWILRGWGELSVWGRAGGVLLTVAGGMILGLIALLIVIVTLMTRMVRGLKRDARSVAGGVSYMLRMGRPPSPRSVEEQGESDGTTMGEVAKGPPK